MSTDVLVSDIDSRIAAVQDEMSRLREARKALAPRSNGASVKPRARKPIKTNVTVKIDGRKVADAVRDATKATAKVAEKPAKPSSAPRKPREGKHDKPLHDLVQGEPGISVLDAGKRLSVSSQYLYKRLDAAGVERRDKGLHVKASDG